MKTYLLPIVFFFATLANAQTHGEIINKIEAHRVSENEHFSNPETTILELKDAANFSGLEFYPIDLQYRVEADFIRTPNETPFLMPTTTSRLPEYVKFGEAHFILHGEKLKLELYQSTGHENEEGYEDYLFLPITDLTSGDGSYGGGRFLEARIPEGNTIVLDFNLLYNPYCAYNKRYSCPIPPKANDLLVRIEAGVKDFKSH